MDGAGPASASPTRRGPPRPSPAAQGPRPSAAAARSERARARALALATASLGLFLLCPALGHAVMCPCLPQEEGIAVEVLLGTFTRDPGACRGGRRCGRHPLSL